MFKTIIILIITIITTTNGALLFWSKIPFQVSPLIHFDDNDLDELKEKMGNPITHIYKTSAALSSDDFKQILNGYHTYYNPNGDLNNSEYASEIADDLDDMMRIKHNLEQLQNDNVLSIVIIPNRFKREIVENTDTDITVNPSIDPTGPVLYKARDKNDESIYVLMYSTQLLLRVNDSNYQIGETSSEMTTIDNRGNFVKFSVKVPSDDFGKITLNFLFLWYGSYWQLNSVKITDLNNNYNFNLTIENSINVPAHFSYHCSGNTIFSDNSNNNSVELYIRDLQVQIDAADGKFSDAYDCVPFTTIPIWSGLMVAGIMGIGLIVGLTAMLDIKTMDKFDNYKTKQLTISVVE